MPKRGNRRRRGGTGGGGRRTPSGANRGRHPSRGNKNRSPRTITQYGDLMDDDNIFIPKTMSEVASNMGRRKYGGMFEEIEYTESHQEDLMSRQLRNRPVEFVKAKEVYDPNVILYKLAKLNNKDDGIDIAVQSISLDDSENESSNNKVGISSFSEESEEIEESGDEYEDEQDDEDDWDEEELHNEITTKLEALEEAMNNVSSDTESEQSVSHIEEEQDEKVESHIPEPDLSAEVDEPLQEIDESESRNQVKSEVGTNTNTQDIETLDIIIDLPSNKVESHSSHSLPQKSKTPSSPDDDDDDNNNNSTPESEPEYGYLEEDYEFDVSKIEVSNVRFGIENQYHIKCMELTGSIDEYIWIDENDVIEYVLDNGVKEHRLNKFLSFITKGMIDEQEPEPEPEVYISDSNSEEEEEEEDDYNSEQDDYPYDSDDNLEDLIAYSKTSTQGLIPFEDRDFSNNIPSKKRQTFDHLDFDDDGELQDSLIRQLNNYKANKKLKKHKWEQQKLEESILHHDMLIKYPVSLHIKDIKSEFDQLLKDESRQSMSFPTLDTHGHKTIKNLADCYHMSVIKSGKQGIRKYLKIVKNKATFKYYPNYERIDRILRGRPIFHRIDQKPQHKKGEKSKSKSSRGDASSSRARFKEGDIVGAEAPEIGSSNLGRQMLEKLGWIQGQGLGVDGNKGINEPILAKVKTSKTGIK
ncbi:protein SQS1 [Candida albicans P57055]|nr:protein SQS1 [Candida albicans P57055]